MLNKFSRILYGSFVKFKFARIDFLGYLSCGSCSRKVLKISKYGVHSSNFSSHHQKINVNLLSFH